MKSKKYSKSLFIFFSLAPAMILYILFRIIPTFQVFRMSLFKTSALSKKEKFVGFDNFISLFHDFLLKHRLYYFCWKPASKSTFFMASKLVEYSFSLNLGSISFSLATSIFV